MEGEETHRIPDVDVEFRWAHPEDRDPVESLLDDRLGPSQTESVRAAFDDDLAMHCLVARLDGAVVGTGMVAILSAENLAEVLSVDTDESPVAEYNGLLQAGCVASDATGNGIGTALMAHRVEFCRKHPQMGAVFGTAWRRKDAFDSSAIFEKLGFELLRHDENYYANTGRTCPDCGENCTCSGTVYGLSFEG